MEEQTGFFFIKSAKENRKKTGGEKMIWLIVNLVLGGFAGWFAGKLMNTEGSMVRNVILGLVGGIFGSIVLRFIGIHGSGPIGGTIVSIIGACLLIWISRKLGH